MCVNMLYGKKSFHLTFENIHVPLNIRRFSSLLEVQAIVILKKGSLIS